jgi:aspartate/tyrosine/aromatic aminotransferase
MISSLRQVPGDVVVTPAATTRPVSIHARTMAVIAEVVRGKLLPPWRSPHQGFGGGLEEDAGRLRTFANLARAAHVQLLQGFGIYNERVAL